MRLWTAAILIGATALPLAACNRHTASDGQKAPVQKAVETPKRKPGLWVQTTNIEGIGSIPGIGICLDEATDQKVAWWGQQGTRGGCAKNDVSRNPDGSWSFSSVCQTEGNITTTTQGTVSGDFKSAYQVKATSTTEGSPLPEMNGMHTVTMDAKWTGPCPSGMKPGDMKLPDGSTVNMADIASRQAPPVGAP